MLPTFTAEHNGTCMLCWEDFYSGDIMIIARTSFAGKVVGTHQEHAECRRQLIESSPEDLREDLEAEVVLP
jgi:hypothetical protein